jgi:hypothetical protein
LFGYPGCHKADFFQVAGDLRVHLALEQGAEIYIKVSGGCPPIVPGLPSPRFGERGKSNCRAPFVVAIRPELRCTKRLSLMPLLNFSEYFEIPSVTCST